MREIVINYNNHYNSISDNYNIRTKNVHSRQIDIFYEWKIFLKNKKFCFSVMLIVYL